MEGARPYVLIIPVQKWASSNWPARKEYLKDKLIAGHVKARLIK